MKRAAVLVVLVALLAASAKAQAPVSIDQYLAEQDTQVYTNFSARFTRDQRYDPLFARIYQRVNPHLTEVYANSSKNVQPYSFVSTMGFNAMTWDHIIIFDSLLLDSLRLLSEGITVYGNLDNTYAYKLGQSVAFLQMHAKELPVRADYTNQANIYDLPLAGNLTQQERLQANALFEEMLAAWLGHEGSHAFLNHARIRLQEEQMRALYGNGNMDPTVFGQYVDRYSEAALGQDKEREADEKGAALIVLSGYTVRGFVLSLQFSAILEELTGTSQTFMRTHPPASERIADVENVAARLSRR